MLGVAESPNGNSSCLIPVESWFQLNPEQQLLAQWTSANTCHILHLKARCEPWTKGAGIAEEATTHSITWYFSRSLSSSSLFVCGCQNTNSKAPFLCTFVKQATSPLKLLSVLSYHKKGTQERAGSRQGVDVEEIPKRSPLQHPSDRGDKRGHIQAVPDTPTHSAV